MSAAIFGVMFAVIAGLALGWGTGPWMLGPLVGGATALWVVTRWP